MQRLTLIGYRACGKSTVGRLVAARLAWPFVDADHAIEERLGEAIAPFFRRAGEAAFREVEATVLATLLAGEAPLVLATGGGVVERQGNCDLLRERGGSVVYLRATAAVVQERLRHAQGGRPSLTGAGVAEEAPAIMARRDPLYRAVATHCEDSGPTAEGVADRLVIFMERQMGPPAAG
jgi:shikimate kinase